jgi:thiosulfate/3-mercaptopyruvate sulfurtransferase
MTYSTILSVPELQQLMAQGADVQIWDCSFDLMNPPAAREAFAQVHIDGAVYVDLDTHLSDKSDAADKASGGRHPLPAREKFAAWAASVGVTPATQVVVYDRNGVNYAGRAWWMLRWIGHEAVAVLDGGLQAWQAAGGAVASGASPDFARDLKQNRPWAHTECALIAIETIANAHRQGTHTIIDARAAARFRGEVEPLDAVAGHIPGALNRPFNLNIGDDGKFKSREQLRAEFDALLAGRDASRVIHHCGSGVSAVPNILAMLIAGYPMSGLFAGSWSEWSSRPELPVAQG